MKRDDSLWKAILEDVFDDFLRFFFEKADEIFDFSRPFEFLDKELEQLFPVNSDDFSPKYVDKLVKVFTKAGEEQWVLVHVEVQGSSDRAFAKRMFQYFYRIYDKYDHPIIAFAILTDRNKSFQPRYFEEKFMGTSLRYDFNRYKILEQNELELAKSNNPFAMVVLTALTALKSGKISESELLEQKIGVLKRLVSNNFGRAKIEALMGFLKLYVRFGNPENDIKFDSSLEQLLDKPNKTMGIVEFVLDRERRIGEKRGEKRGEKKGEKKAREQKLTFVRNLITSTDFDNAKIAALADVAVEVVQKLRLELN